MYPQLENFLSHAYQRNLTALASLHNQLKNIRWVFLNLMVDKIFIR